MSSIIFDFEYDIFISYRHKDNKGDHWVTDFVSALKTELEATFKEDISIYFDTNPHDGLLETHNVDKSLKGKLKCLIFIPIISQTYCDPKSFAWQHEFCAFNKLSKDDQFGRDIKLRNGNVASRILPVKIHDLDAEDKLLLENELGGALRAIEFIYKEAGVNRPLKPSDSKNDNQNKTDYRNQVNKVANAVKEIIFALNSPASKTPASAKENDSGKFNNTRNISWKRIALLSFGLMILFALSYEASQFIRAPKEEPHALEKSIAVLPFVDLSPGRNQSWFSDGLTEEILNSLTHVKGLNVIARTSSFAFKDKNFPITKIADSLGVNYVVEGSVRESKDKIRITAQLIRAKDGFHIWSHNYDHTSTEDIFKVQQEIASQIAENLDVYLDLATIEKMKWAGTNNPEAFLSFLKGAKIVEEFDKGHRSDLKMLQEANVWFEKAIESDPEFVNPYYYHCRFFLRYLMHKDNQTYRPDTLSREDAYRVFTSDLEHAITKSKTDVDKDFFRLCDMMYSDDWTGVRPIIERILASPEAVRLFSFRSLYPQLLMIALGYGEKIRSVSKEILKRDPINPDAHDDILLSLRFAEHWKEANAYLDSASENLSKNEYRDNKIMVLLELGETDRAVRLVEQWGNDYAFGSPAMMALLLVKTGKKLEAEAKLKLASDDTPWFLMRALSELHGKVEANNAAADLDKRLLISLPLLDCYVNFPNQLPFDLSATPNFARRLTQAGIAIEQNH